MKSKNGFVFWMLAVTVVAFGSVIQTAVPTTGVTSTRTVRPVLGRGPDLPIIVPQGGGGPVCIPGVGGC